LIVPPVDPIAVGLKLTLSSTLCPGANTSGRLNWDRVNAGLLVVIAVTVTLVCPVFVRAANKVSV
jgi:hypothetical protein